MIRHKTAASPAFKRSRIWENSPLKRIPPYSFFRIKPTTTFVFRQHGFDYFERTEEKWAQKSGGIPSSAEKPIDFCKKTWYHKALMCGSAQSTPDPTVGIVAHPPRKRKRERSKCNNAPGRFKTIKRPGTTGTRRPALRREAGAEGVGILNERQMRVRHGQGQVLRQDAEKKLRSL